MSNAVAQNKIRLDGHAEKTYRREDGSDVRIECRGYLSFGTATWDLRVWKRAKRKRHETYEPSAATAEEKQEVALMAWESIKPNFLEAK